MFRSGYSLWIIPPEHPLRTVARWLVESRPFELLVLLSIFCNLVLLASSYVDESWSSAVETAFLVLFWAELGLKVVAHGWVLDEGSYLRDPLNALDGAIILASTVILWAAHDPRPAYVVLVVRILHPVARLTQLDGLQRLRLSLMKSMRPLMTALGLLGIFFLLFALISVTLFQGRLTYRCVLDADGTVSDQYCGNYASSRSCSTGYTCVDTGENPAGGLRSFDNIPVALVTIFSITTLDKWSDLMYDTMDATHPASCIFFILVVVCNSFFLMNLAFAIIRSGFEKLVVASEVRAEAKQRKEEAEAQKRASRERARIRRNKRRAPGTDEEPPEVIPTPWYVIDAIQWPWFDRVVRAPVTVVTTHIAFDTAFFILTIINIGFLASEYNGQPDALTTFLYYGNLVLTILFTIEFVAKWLTLGLLYYWVETWLNWLDFIVVVVGLLEFGLSNSGSLNVIRIVRVLRMFRIMRVLKVLGRFKSLARLVEVVAQSMHDIGYTGIFLVVFLVIYATVGMYTFKDHFYNYDGVIGSAADVPRLNFNDFLNSLFLCFHMLTLDEWSQLLYDGVASTNWAAAIYFISWVVLGVYVLLNIFNAIIVTSFELQQQKVAKARIDRLKRKKLFLLYTKHIAEAQAASAANSAAASIGSSGGNSGAITPAHARRVFNPFVARGGKMVASRKTSVTSPKHVDDHSVSMDDEALSGMKLKLKERRGSTGTPRHRASSTSGDESHSHTHKSNFSAFGGTRSRLDASEPNSATSQPRRGILTRSMSGGSTAFGSMFTFAGGIKDRQLVGFATNFRTVGARNLHPASGSASPAMPPAPVPMPNFTSAVRSLTVDTNVSILSPSADAKPVSLASPSLASPPLASPSASSPPVSSPSLLRQTSATARLIAQSKLRPQPPTTPKPQPRPPGTPAAGANMATQVLTGANGSSAMWRAPRFSGRGGLGSSSDLTSPTWQPPPLLKIGSRSRVAPKPDSTSPADKKTLFPFALTTTQQRYFRESDNASSEYEDSSDDDPETEDGNDTDAANESGDAVSEADEASIALSLPGAPPASSSPPAPSPKPASRRRAHLERLGSKHFVMTLPSVSNYASSADEESSRSHSHTPAASMPASRRSSLIAQLPLSRSPSASATTDTIPEEDHIVPAPRGPISPAVLAFVARSRAAISQVTPGTTVSLPISSPLAPSSAAAATAQRPPSSSPQPPLLSRSLSPSLAGDVVPVSVSVSRVSSVSSSVASAPGSPTLGSFTSSRRSAFTKAAAARNSQDATSSYSVTTDTIATSGNMPPLSPNLAPQMTPPPPPPSAPPSIPPPPFRQFNSARDLLSAPGASNQGASSASSGGSVSPSGSGTPRAVVDTDTSMVMSPHALLRLSRGGAAHSPTHRSIPPLGRPRSSMNLLSVSDAPRATAASPLLRGILKVSPNGSGAVTPVRQTKYPLTRGTGSSPMLLDLPRHELSPKFGGRLSPGASPKLQPELRSAMRSANSSPQPEPLSPTGHINGPGGFFRPPMVRGGSKTVVFADQTSQSSPNLAAVAATEKHLQPTPTDALTLMKTSATSNDQGAASSSSSSPPPTVSVPPVSDAAVTVTLDSIDPIQQQRSLSVRLSVDNSPAIELIPLSKSVSVESEEKEEKMDATVDDHADPNADEDGIEDPDDAVEIAPIISSSDDEKPAWQVELEQEILADEVAARQALLPPPPPHPIARILSFRVAKAWAEPRRPVSYVPYNYYKGHYLSRHEWFRMLSHFVFHKNLEYFIIVFVLLSSFSMTLETHSLDTAHGLGHSLWILDIVCVTVFTTEMVLKVLCMGIIGMEDAYLGNNWNRLDFVIVITNLLTLTVSLGRFKALRALRVLRPLRLIMKNGGIRTVINTLTQSVVPMLNVLLLLVLSFLTFGILGVRLWSGQMSFCRPSEGPAALYGDDNTDHTALQESLYLLDEAACLAASMNGTATWSPPRKNFDNIWNAVVALFSISTLQNWSDLCYATMDITGSSSAPRTNAMPVYALFFVAFIFLVPWVLNGLYIGVVFDTFVGLRDESSGLGLLSDAQKLWVQSQMRLLEARPGIVPPVPYRSRVRTFCYELIFHPRFEKFIVLCVVANVIVMGLTWPSEPDTLSSFREIANVVFFFVYVVEMGVKLTALGTRLYFDDTWNRFDAVIVLGSLGEEVLTLVPGNYTDVVMFLKIFRIFRLFRVIKRLTRVQVLLRSIYLSLPKIANVAFLLLFIFFVFSIVGVELFGDVETGVCIGGNVGFGDFPHAVLTLFRVATGQDWDCIMYDCMDSDNDGTPLAIPYFLIFLLCVNFTCLSLFIAVLLDNLSLALHQAAVASARLHRRHMMLTFQKQSAMLELEHTRQQFRIRQEILEDKQNEKHRARAVRNEKRRRKQEKMTAWAGVAAGAGMRDKSLHDGSVGSLTSVSSGSPTNSIASSPAHAHPHHLSNSIGITRSQRQALRTAQQTEYTKVMAATRARQKADAKRLARKTAGTRIKTDHELLSSLQLTESEPAFMETLIGEYVDIWQTLDPNATRFVPVVKLPEILRRLDTPLGVGPQGSLYKMIVRCAGVTLRKHRFPPNPKFERCVHFSELLHGLLHYLFGAEVPDGLTHVTTEVRAKVEKSIGIIVAEHMERDPLATAGVWLACQAMEELWHRHQKRRQQHQRQQQQHLAEAARQEDAAVEDVVDAHTHVVPMIDVPPMLVEAQEEEESPSQGKIKEDAQTKEDEQAPPTAPLSASSPIILHGAPDSVVTPTDPPSAPASPRRPADAASPP